MRQGDYKLIEFDEDRRVELYNLRTDLAETTNLAGQMPELVATLRGKLAAWRKSVGAQMPLSTTGRDPARASSQAGSVPKP